MAKDGRLDRRTFLRGSAASAGVVAAANVCGCALFNKNTEDLTVEPDQQSFTLSMSQYPQLAKPDGVVNVEARDGDERVVILRTREGAVVALSMVCTHWSCDVDWAPEEQLFVCPCHSSRFDTAGKVLEGPAEEPLRQFAVTDDGETITVDLGAPRG